MSTFAERIRALRKARGASEEAFGADANVSQQVVSNWEWGRSHPRFDDTPRIADALGVSVEWLVAGRGEPPAELAVKKAA